MDNIKTLHVPCLEQLDTLSDENILRLLDDNGKRQIIDNLNWPEQYPYQPLATFNIAHSRTAIYIDFFVRCNYLRAVNTANNSNVYQDSCVEFFVQPDPADNHYYNFEFNCIGTIHAARRLDRHSGELLPDAALNRVRRVASCGNAPFEEIEGMFSWSLLVVIPFDLLGIKFDGSPIAMRGNFYKCADMTSVPHFLSWAPITTPTPDFHRPEFFGNIILEP